MRIFLIAIVFLSISFGTPFRASAQTCTAVGAPCTVGNITGVCVRNETGDFSCGTGATLNPSQAQSAGGNTTLINPLKSGDSLEGFLRSILQFIVRIGAVVIILMIVFVGYKFVTARGAPAKIEDAKGMLLWTVIGALVLLGAQAIATAIQATVTALGG